MFTTEQIKINNVEGVNVLSKNYCKFGDNYLFVLFEALHPGQQFFSHFGMASWV